MGRDSTRSRDVECAVTDGVMRHDGFTRAMLSSFARLDAPCFSGLGRGLRKSFSKGLPGMPCSDMAFLIKVLPTERQSSFDELVDDC